MITFLRHAESVNNRYHLDEQDPPLTDDGIVQARLLKGDYDYILISPMLRTRETYEFSQITGSIIEYSTLCREKIGTAYHHGQIMAGEQNLIEPSKSFDYRMHLLELDLKEKITRYDRILVITHHGVIKALTNQSAKNASLVHLNL